jgi:hypothetical protein
MNEEELFCKLFPEYVVNGKPLSPYFDLFESGYEQLENRIDELEAEVKEWKDKADLWCKTANLKDHNIMINKELEKENADLKEEINKIAFARGNLEEENAELKGLKDVATLIRANNDTVTTLMQLNNMLVSKSQQLTKAKEIIRKLIEAIHIWDCKNLEQVEAEAEQFISDVEK